MNASRIIRIISVLLVLVLPGYALAKSHTPLTINKIEPNAVQNTLVISGIGFLSNDPAESPTTIKLSGYATPLEHGLIRDTSVTVLLPIGVFGSGYAITVAYGTKDGEFDQLPITLGGTGPEGPRGPMGITGLQGAQGLKGDTGAVGPQGLKGDTGGQGTQGAQGPKGDTGATGAQGLKGDTGATGPQGFKGDTGVTGANGDTGNTGATGLQGLQGLKGDTGAQGSSGPVGPAGASGAGSLTLIPLFTVSLSCPDNSYTQGGNSSITLSPSCDWPTPPP